MPRLFWTPARLDLIAGSVVVAVLVGIFSCAFLNPLVLTQGDFPSFYAAAQIMLGGNGGLLYSGTLQRALQNDYWPYFNNFYIYFPYPPYTALLLAPLAMLPPELSKIVFDTLMITLWISSFIIAGKFIPLISNNLLGTAAFMVSFMPVFMPVLGGQNISLSLFFYSLVLWTLSIRTRWADWLCGLALGLWLFKPQYPLMLAFFLLLAGYWRVMIAFTAVALFYYGIAAWAVSWDWPEYWRLAITWFSEENFKLEGYKMIPMLPALTLSLKTLGVSPGISNLVINAAKVFAVGLGLTVAGLFWKAGRIKEPAISREKVRDLMCLAGPAIIFLAPHAMFYEVGLCIFPVAKFLKFEKDREVTLFLLLMAVTVWIDMQRDTFPVSPLALYVLASLIFVWKKIGVKPSL